MEVQFETIRNSELLQEMQSVLSIISNWMGIPLFLVFWIADIIYVPQFKWEFLAIRLLVVPVCLVVFWYSKKCQDVKAITRLALFYACSLAAGINLMIYMIPDPFTPYYAGLGLVSIGALGFIPFSPKEFCFATLGIYLPYYLIVVSKAHALGDFSGVLLNSFFIGSSICMCFLIRYFQGGLRLKEIRARFQLRQELENRDEIIRAKTEDAVKLSAMSAQFSPQLVESIRTGKVTFEQGGKRAPICAMFIDIVNSTERVTRIDKDKVERTLSRFLDDSIRIMLKYDITIDKFLGDGILGFCNAPMERSDYTSRVISAAIEIREKIALEKEFFERNWQKELEIRVGIAKGYANVGFYGSQKYYKNYTAIGPVMNLAARLCSSAEPNQIVTDYDVFEEVQDDFDTSFLGRKSLKGFEQDVTHVYEILGSRKFKALNPGMSECPECGSILSLETNARGQFVFMCKSCCSVVENVAPAVPTSVAS